MSVKYGGISSVTVTTAQFDVVSLSPFEVDGGDQECSQNNGPDQSAHS